MNLSDLTPLEIGGLILLLSYLIIPVPSPAFLDGIVDSPMGIAVMLLGAVYLYFYVNPILSILFIFVVYEFLRRMNATQTKRMKNIQFTPSQAKKDEQMAEMNNVKVDALEIDVVSNMAPIGKSDPVQFLSSSYKPITESIGTASTY